MEAKRSGARWTYAEFARLPSEGSTRYEVIAGELVVTPGPTPRHQEIATRLVVQLYPFVHENGLGQAILGPVDVLFAEGDYLEPDLIFVRKDRLDIVSDRGIEGPPDLVVEVISPSTARRDRGIKLERYRRYGVAEYWIVDPDARAIEVWRLAAGAAAPERLGPGDLLTWQPVAGRARLELDVAELIAA